MVHITSYRLLSSLLVSQQAIKAFSFSTTTVTTASTTTMASIPGIVMVISPAKTLDLKRLSEREGMELDHDTIASISSSAATSLCDKDKTRTIVNIMKKKSNAELKSLLSLSPSLANTAHQYWSDFTMDSNKDTNKKKDKDEMPLPYSHLMVQHSKEFRQKHATNLPCHTCHVISSYLIQSTVYYVL